MAASLFPSGSQATITIFSKGDEVNYVLLLNNIRLIDVPYLWMKKFNNVNVHLEAKHMSMKTAWTFVFHVVVG
jgi:hypothetical protein